MKKPTTLILILLFPLFGFAQKTLMIARNSLALLLLGLTFFGNALFAQDLSISKSSTQELTKASRGALYGGTLVNGEHAKVLFVSSTKDEGAQIEEYNFDISGGPASVQDKFISANEAEQQLPWFLPKSRIENLASGSGKWLKATAAFGSGMKLERGYIQKNYFNDTGVYLGMQFVMEESIKPKTGDIWRITPGGYKSLSDVDALATENGFYEDLEKYGNPLLMPANSTLLAAGVITEKVSLKSDQKYASNRVAVLAMNGTNFDDMQYDIYMLPYTASTVASGLGQDDNMASLFAPLNGPTTLASLKHLYWKDQKDHFTLMRFNDERKLVDSVSFKSKMMWGDYQILNGQGGTFVFGKGDAKFDGWYRGLEYNKVTGFQVTKIKDGELIYNKMFTIDDLTNKLVGPGGKKVKFGMNVKHNKLKEVIDLPNGEALIIGQTPMEVYMLQMTADGDLKTFYLFPLGKLNEIPVVNYQYMMKDNDLIFVVNLQPIEFSTLAKIETRSASFTAGGYKTTITETTVKKLNEVYMQSMAYRIAPASAKVSNALALDGKEFYPMGSFPAMFTKDAIYFTGREKGPKGKVIHVVRVDL